MSQYRSIIFKGFSPAYDSITINKVKVLWLLKKDANNYSELNIDNTTKKFNYVKCVNGTVVILSSAAQTFNKFQAFNIECSQTNAGMVMRILKNAGTVEKVTNTDITTFTGTAKFYQGLRDVAGNEADGYLGTWHPIDLDKASKQGGYSDAEMLGILNGTTVGCENPELLDNTASTTQTVPVFPNNRFELKTDKSVTVREKYNTIVVKTTTYTGNTTFVTGNSTNKVQFDVTGDFSTLSFKRKD